MLMEGLRLYDMHGREMIGYCPAIYFIKLNCNVVKNRTYNSLKIVFVMLYLSTIKIYK
jgi:hypothetical protein